MVTYANLKYLQKLECIIPFLTFSDTTCQGVVEGLEGIDDEVDEIGIAFVKTRNEDYPYRTHDISSFPVLGLYRNGGDFIQYDGMLIV